MYVDYSTRRWRLGDYGGEITGAVYSDRARQVPRDISVYPKVEFELSEPGFVTFREPVTVNQSDTNRWSLTVHDGLFTLDGIYRCALVLNGENLIESTTFEEFTVVA